MESQAGAFEVVAEAIEDGIVIANGDSRIEWCNRGAASMFGWTADEARGRSLTDLMPPRYREAHLQGMSQLLAGGEPRLVGRGPVEIEALGPDGREIPVELTLGRLDAEPGKARFIAVLRSISDRRRSERERDAQLAVARALTAAATLDEAAGALISALAGAMEWEFGAFWMLDEAASVLACEHAWSHHPDGPAGFRQATIGMTFRRGTGLPGRAWEQGRTVWLRDAVEERSFLRAGAAAEAGLHGAVAIPVFVDQVFVGVLEFFSSRLADPDEGYETILQTAGDQLAQFLQRRRAEDELADARRELEAQRFAQRQTTEINDNIIHWLVQVVQALDGGDERAAKRATHEALNHASRIITELQTLPRPVGRTRTGEGRHSPLGK